ncbi:MAG: amidohydrolase family protein [Candidatus Ranarchaeia archaeon]|jgi:5-methylthioadenosine/S-adenosylhomocysteine deaminase
MTDLILTNAHIITVDKKRRCISKGTIVIEGQNIEAIGKETDILPQFKSEVDKNDIWDLKGKIILPGFINTHSHLFQTYMRGLGADLEILDWWPNTVKPIAVNMTPEDVYNCALVGIIESIKSGVTTILDNHYLLFNPKLGDAAVDALRDSGIRGYEALNSAIKDDFNVLPEGWVKSSEQDLKNWKRMYDKYHGKADGRLGIWHGTGAPFSITTDHLNEVVEITSERNTGMVGHYCESMREVNGFKKAFGETPIKYFSQNSNLLCDRLISIHSIWLSDEEIGLFAKNGVRVSHNPSSNAILGSGVCPVTKYLKKGVLVSIGLDGPASNDGQDMLEAIKQTAFFQKVHNAEPNAISGDRVLEMATIDGANSMHLGATIGSLEVGKKADLVVINPWMTNMMPLNRPASAVVYSAKAENVDTVIIDGKIILKDRRLTALDESQILQESHTRLEALVEQSAVAQKNRVRPWDAFPQKTP